jgi:hypothetical protein
MCRFYMPIMRAIRGSGSFLPSLFTGLARHDGAWVVKGEASRANGGSAPESSRRLLPFFKCRIVLHLHPFCSYSGNVPVGTFPSPAKTSSLRIHQKRYSVLIQGAWMLNVERGKNTIRGRKPRGGAFSCVLGAVLRGSVPERAGY